MIINKIENWCSYEFLNKESTPLKDKLYLNDILVENLIIPEGVTSIGESAFYYCQALENVTIPDSMISIGAYAFSECSSLKNITLPYGMTQIGRWAFEKCASLESVSIPATVTHIDWYTFSGCTSLKSVTIPDPVVSIGEKAFGYYIDFGHEKIEDFTIYGSNSAAKTYANKNDFNFNKTCKIHTLVTDEGKAPTCISTGLTKGRRCSVCNMILIKQEVLEKTNPRDSEIRTELEKLKKELGRIHFPGEEAFVVAVNEEKLKARARLNR